MTSELLKINNQECTAAMWPLTLRNQAIKSLKRERSSDQAHFLPIKKLDHSCKHFYRWHASDYPLAFHLIRLQKAGEGLRPRLLKPPTHIQLTFHHLQIVQQVTKDGWRWRFRKFMWGMILHNWGNRLMLCCNHIVLNTHTEEYYGSATVQCVGPGTDK